MPQVTRHTALAARHPSTQPHQTTDDSTITAIIMFLHLYRKHVSGLRIVGSSTGSHPAMNVDFLVDLKRIFPHMACVLEMHQGLGTDTPTTVITQNGDRLVFNSVEHASSESNAYLPPDRWAVFFLEAEYRPYQALYTIVGGKLAAFISQSILPDAANYLVPFSPVSSHSILVVCPPACHVTTSLPTSCTTLNSLQMEHMRQYVYCSVTSTRRCYQCEFIHSILTGTGGQVPTVTLGYYGVSQEFL